LEGDVSAWTFPNNAVNTETGTKGGGDGTLCDCQAVRINFVVFAACAFVLWFWAALINRLAQAVGLSTPEHLANAAASIASSSTLQAISASGC